MAKVISYKGQKYVRVDSLTKKVHRTDMVVSMVDRNYSFLKEYIQALETAIKVAKKLQTDYWQELKDAKIDMGLLSKIKGKKDKIYELNESEDESFFDAISWEGDSGLREVKDFIQKYS